MQRCHLSAEPAWQQLLDLGQGSQRRFVHAGDCGSGGRAQPNSDCDGLVVVEQQRWHVGPGCEAVAAFGSWRGVDGITKFAEPVDVTPHGSFCYFEARSQFSSAPQTVGLKEGEQL